MIASILPVPTFSCSGEHTMFGPGEYVLDPTEGIVDIEELPRPQLVAYSRNHEHTLCPRCDHLAYCHECGQRTLHVLFINVMHVVMHVSFSIFYCVCPSCIGCKTVPLRTRNSVT